MSEWLCFARKHFHASTHKRGERWLHSSVQSIALPYYTTRSNGCQAARRFFLRSLDGIHPGRPLTAENAEPSAVCRQVMTIHSSPRRVTQISMMSPGTSRKPEGEYKQVEPKHSDANPDQAFLAHSPSLYAQGSCSPLLSCANATYIACLSVQRMKSFS